MACKLNIRETVYCGAKKEALRLDRNGCITFRP